MSISTPVWTSTSFFPPPNSSRLWPSVRKKGTLSGNPIKGVREFSAKPERSRMELRAVSYREADVRGRESPDSGIPYIGTYLYYICVVHISDRSASYFPPYLSTYPLPLCIDTSYVYGWNIAHVYLYYISRNIEWASSRTETLCCRMFYSTSRMRAGLPIATVSFIRNSDCYDFVRLAAYYIK